MKLKSIRMHPFAGIRDNEYAFKEGMNVLQGPNEAGKSTLFHAIWNGLLTTTSFTAQQLENTMGRYFPSSGGDVIRVSLELADENGGTVHIHKTWKKGTRNGSATLQLSNGMEITNEEEVQRKITEFLPVSPATMKTILLADQSGLHHTIRQMEREDNVRKELGDLLRQSLMETAGVSVDRFRELLDTRYEEYFKRWNRNQDYPEKNRGINNPYKINTGKILDAYYKKEFLRRDLEKAREFENDLDQMNERLSGLMKQQNGKQEEFESLEPLKRGITQRKDYEQRLENAELKKKSLLEISRKWPVLEDRIRNLEPQKRGEQEKITKLRDEQEKAQNKQRALQLESKLEKMNVLTENVKSAHQELQEAQKVDPRDVQRLRRLQQEIRVLKSRIESARLTLRIQSDEEQAIGFREAGKSEEEIVANRTSMIEKKASGGFSLSFNGLKIDVFSGEGDLEQVVKEVAGKELELKQTLEDLNVDSLQSAESLAELYRQKREQFVSVRSVYKSEIGSDDIETLKNELKELGNPTHARAMQDINNDLVEAQTALKTLEREAVVAQEQLDKWKGEYDSAEEVHMELGERMYQSKQLKTELERLPELPVGYESADEFIRKVELLDREIRQLEQRINQLKLEKADLERDVPENSSEELEEMTEEAESEFERTHKEGETLAMVRERALGLLGLMDADTYSGLEKSFLHWLQQMSGERFQKIEMNGDMPSKFTMDDGRLLTYELLSHGTKDTVALAWRFALTEYFLKEKKGFIILDDPMVDMDPARRELASKAIEEFADNQQVILLTCHPEHQRSFEQAKLYKIDAIIEDG